jgi:hypothetical protein
MNNLLTELFLPNSLIRSTTCHILSYNMEEHIKLLILLHTILYYQVPVGETAMARREPVEQ